MLKNSIALVTGASGYIGIDIAKKLALNGATIAIHASNKLNATKTIDKILDNNDYHNYQFFPVYGDITNTKDIKQILFNINHYISQHNNNNLQFNTLINAAGYNKDGLLLRLDDKNIHKIINTNIIGSILLSKYTIKNMLKSKNQNQKNIIHIGSAVTQYNPIGQSVYTSSKIALTSLVKTLSKELKHKNININCISPGYINGGQTNVLSVKQKEFLKNEHIALNRFGTANEISDLVYYLCTNGNYINGETINIDGGIY